MPQRATAIRVKIEPGESLLGYMSRVAAANVYDSPAWLLDDHGTQTYLDTGTWTDATIEQVAAITGSERADIERRVYRGVGNDRRLYFGQDIPGSLLVPSAQKCRRRFCPRCLEGGTHHAIFDLALVTACPIHSCRTTDRCPACSKLVLWRGTSIFYCHHCGYDLRRARTESVDLETLNGLRALLDRYGLTHGAVCSEATWPTTLDHLRLCEMAELMLGLASYLGSRTSGADFLEFSETARGRVHLDLAVGWKATREWPAHLPEFLEQYQARIKTTGITYGAEPAFGRFYTHVRQAKREPWLTVRTAFIQFLETSWIGNAIPRPDKATKAPPIMFKTKSVSIAEAGRIIGRSPASINKLLGLGILESTKAGDFWGAPNFVTRSSIEEIAPGERQPVRLDQLGAELGVSRQRQRQFVDGGVFQPVLGPRVDGSKVYLFRATDAAELLGDIARHMRSTPKPVKKKSFADVLKGARTRMLGVKPIIEAMRDGRLPAIGRDDRRSGLNAYRFGFAQSQKLLADLEANADEVAEQMTVAIAGRCLAFHLIRSLTSSQPAISKEQSSRTLCGSSDSPWMHSMLDTSLLHRPRK